MAEHGGANFHCTNKALPVKQSRIFSTVEQSVGLITIENEERVIGTGFVVGKGYLMTAYHIFTDKIDSLLDYIAWYISTVQFRRWARKYFPEGQGLDASDAIPKYLEKQMTLSIESFRNFMEEKCYERLSDKWCKECFVQFWKYSDTGHDSKESTFFFSPYIPFADRENDVIILKISEDTPESLPPSLLLIEEFEDIEKVNLYGYLDHKNKRVLHMDPQSTVYVDNTRLDHDLQKATKWWEKKESKLDSGSGAKQINVARGFRQCSSTYNLNHGCITLHASKSFIFGTSGSPLLFLKEINNQDKPVVMGMYLRGYPDFYYKVKKSIETGQQLPSELSHYNKFRNLLKSGKHIPLKCFFEAAITMQRVAHVLDQRPQFKHLKGEMFEKQDQEEMLDIQKDHSEQKIHYSSDQQKHQKFTSGASSSTFETRDDAETYSHGNLRRTSSQRSLQYHRSARLASAQETQETNCVVSTQGFGDDTETKNSGNLHRTPSQASLYYNVRVRLKAAQQHAQEANVMYPSQKSANNAETYNPGYVQRIPSQRSLHCNPVIQRVAQHPQEAYGTDLSEGYGIYTESNYPGNVRRTPSQHKLHHQPSAQSKTTHNRTQESSVMDSSQSIRDDSESNYPSNVRRTPSQRNLHHRSSPNWKSTQHTQKTNVIDSIERCGDDSETNNFGKIQRTPSQKSLHKTPSVRLETVQQNAQGTYNTDSVTASQLRHYNPSERLKSAKQHEQTSNAMGSSQTPGDDSVTNNSSSIQRTPSQRYMHYNRSVRIQAARQNAQELHTRDLFQRLGEDMENVPRGDLQRTPSKASPAIPTHTRESGRHMDEVSQPLKFAWDESSQRSKGIDSSRALRRTSSEAIQVRPNHQDIKEGNRHGDEISQSVKYAWDESSERLKENVPSGDLAISTHIKESYRQRDDISQPLKCAWDESSHRSKDSIYSKNLQRSHSQKASQKGDQGTRAFKPPLPRRKTSDNIYPNSQSRYLPEHASTDLNNFSEERSQPYGHRDETLKHPPYVWTDQPERPRDATGHPPKDPLLQQEEEIITELQNKAWFHSTLTRFEAERFVLQQFHGAFLVRHSQTYPGQYVITYNNMARAEHKRMKINEIGKFIRMLPRFESIFDILQRPNNKHNRNAEVSSTRNHNNYAVTQYGSVRARVQSIERSANYT